MVKNYLKIAVRNLLKNKSYLAINSLGMGIAIACCLSAYLLIAYNIEFNNAFNEDRTVNTVKVMSHMEHQNGNEFQNLVAPLVMGPIAAEDITGIKNFTRLCSDGGSISDGDEAFSERVNFADSSFFDMFDIPLLYGSYEYFKEPNAIYLSEALSTKLFADENPTGKALTVEFRNKEYEVLVGGVLAKLPLNTSFYLDALMRVEKYIEIYDIGPNEWEEWREASILFELENIDQLSSVEEQLNRYVAVRNEVKKDIKTSSYELIPFNEILYEDESNWSFLNSKIELFPLMVFMSLAFIILLIACFNLTNTTIALTIKRLKEIGVRKVVGARRDQVVTQFLLEITLTTLLAILVGLSMSYIIVPEFAAMWGLQYGMEDLSGLNLIFALLIILFVVALLAGAYPALHNSRFKPVALLKGVTKVKGTNPLTRVLLVIQFSLSVIVLVGGVIFTMNADYQKSISFGYNQNKILTVSLQSDSEFYKLKSAIQANTMIEEIAVTDHHIGWGSYPNPVQIDTSEIQTQVYEVGANYFSAMGMNVVDGRGFIVDSQSDADGAAMVDESFVAFHNLKDPIDTRIIHQEKEYRVVGVVQDHINSLFGNNDLKEGHFYRVASPLQYHLLVARVDENDMEEAKEYIEGEWKKIYPNKPFNSRTQAEILFANSMEVNRNLTQIFLFLTILGCLLSASGIYSLANLNIEKRTKEIGIRKVLGASIASIIQLINREFAIVLGLAMIFGSIGGFFLTDILISEIYTLHIEISILPVMLCGLFIFLVGISTTSGTIFKAAVANPATTLRDE